MSTSQKISSIQKQNESIYKSLISKNIEVEQEIIPEDISEEDVYIILTNLNNKLKELAKQNKPVQIKEQKPQIQVNQVNQSTQSNKATVSKTTDLSDEEIEYEPPKPKFETICNMEDIKRAFFSKEYETAFELIKAQQLLFYHVEYKFNSDKDGAPEFSAKNLLKGFVRNFDDFRKYFMICFRCYKVPDDKYNYKSIWIVNTNEPIQSIIGSLYDDFEFKLIESINDIDLLLNQMKKLPEETEGSEGSEGLVGESFVH